MPAARHLFLLVTALMAAMGGSRAGAVVVEGGDGTGNTTAPADDFGFANVGRVWDTDALFYAGGIYLGNGWMITGYHVISDRAHPGGYVFGDVHLAGRSWSIEESSTTRLRNADGTLADLVLFRLTGLPDLPGVSLSGETPAAGTAVVLAGNGYNRQAAQTHWDVNTATEPDLWTVTAGPGDAQGYFVQTSQSLRWGTNSLAAFGDGQLEQIRDDGAGLTSMVGVDFSSGVSGEAQAVGGDSGGGLFYRDGSGAWLLGGVILDQEMLNGQPLSTAVFGNHTYAASVPVYRAQIEAVIPEPSVAVLVLGGIGAGLAARPARGGVRRR